MGPSVSRGRRPRLRDEPSLLPDSDITPQKRRQPLDDLLQNINAQWDLGLPYLHGSRATESEDSSNIARQCSARLRYLYYRDNVKSILEEFDREASRIRSGWVFKPQAESNVVTNRDPTDSPLRRVIFKGKSRALNSDQKIQLLVCLNKVLEGPWMQARQSDSGRTLQSHSRRQNSSTDTSLSRSASMMLEHTKVTKPGAQTSTPSKKPTTVTRSSSKRQSDLGETGDNQAKKKKISDFFVRSHPTSTDHNINGSRISVGDDHDMMIDEGLSLSASNDTIALSDVADPSFPSTQEYAALFDDPLVKQSMNTIDSGYQSGYLSTYPSSDQRLSSLQARLSCTFDSSDLAPRSLSYEFVYELQSLAFSLSKTPKEIWRSVLNECTTDMPNSEQRLRAYKTIAEGHAYEPFTSLSWDPDAGIPPEKQSHFSTYQEVTLLWPQKKTHDHNLFQIRLHAPRTLKSCRFHRIFGGHRFLILNIPEWKDNKMPAISELDFWQAVSQWLCDGFDINHRHWEPLWVEDKPKKDKKTGERLKQVHLFATTGLGLQDPIPIREFLNLHAPFEANKNSSTHKLFARGKLGLSKTIPTVTLRPDQFRRTDDIESDTGKVMTDGCGLMSADLGVAIARCLNLDQVPSAFQGRIGGAKGMWIVDRFSSVSHAGDDPDLWIEIRPSQLKILPHPAERECIDELRTFEVCEWPKLLQATSLNRQLLTVLHSGGVGRRVLTARMKSLTDKYYNELRESLEKNEPLLTHAWLQKYHSGRSQSDQYKFAGGRPFSKVDQIKTYLDSGFSPRDHGPLRDLVAETLKSYLNDFVENPRIELACSTVAYMLPDVWGFLQEGEVQLCLGRAWLDPETGMSTTFIADVDCLVARNPANDPSDVQRVRIAHYVELAGYANVVFFSTKGDRPLADLLSGGDYDGDMAFICWDREIVEQYQNFVRPSGPEILPADVGIVECSTKLSTIFPDQITNNSVKAYLKTCLEFALCQGFLGIVTNTHVEHVYFLSTNKGTNEERRKALQSPSAIKLATLASFLVDALKQGYRLSPDAWQTVRTETCGNRLRKPAYLEDEDSIPADFEGVNILDYLRFNVARNQKAILIDAWWALVRTWSLKSKTDEHLLRPSIAFDAHVNEEREQSTERVCRQVSDRLKNDLNEIFDQWRIAFAQKPGRNLATPFEVIPELYNSYKKIEPFQPEGQENHWLCRMFSTDKRMGTNVWRSLRASFLYRHFKNAKFVWTLAGMDLCHVKANEMGRTIPVQARTYGAMKLNLKAVRNLIEMPDIDLDADFELVDEDEETQWHDALTSLDEPPQKSIREYW